MQLGDGEIAGGCILLLAGAAGVVLSARILDREALVLELEAGAITTRGLVTRRLRARAPLDAASEVLVGVATLVGPAGALQDYSPSGSKRVVHEFDLRVRIDEEREVTLARIRCRKDAEALAQWVDAERAAIMR
jgi:hypothetical protein